MEVKMDPIKELQVNLLEILAKTTKFECSTFYSDNKLVLAFLFTTNCKHEVVGPYFRNINKFSNLFILFHSCIGSFSYNNIRGVLG